MPARGAPLASRSVRPKAKEGANERSDVADDPGVPRGAVRAKAGVKAGAKEMTSANDRAMGSGNPPQGATAERRVWKPKPEPGGLGGGKAAPKAAPVLMPKTGGDTQAAGSRWQSASLAGSKTAGSAKELEGGGLAWKKTLSKVDGEGTNRAIQETWRSKGGRNNKGDVSGMCKRINSLLENPLMVGDEEEASLRIQRLVRGWLVRSRRARGELYPLEAQALADGQYLLEKYGARVFALSPRGRRRMVNPKS